MYKYKNIAFRVIEDRDLDVLMQLHNDQETFLNLASIHLVDKEDQIQWLKGLHRKNNDKRYIICLAENSNVIIGRLRIQNIDHQNSNTEIGLDIVPSERGKGFGKLSYEMLLEFLFMHFNMNMVYLKVADYNEKASSLYKKIGFLNTGFLKNYLFRHGRYVNYNIMCITKDDYLKKYREN